MSLPGIADFTITEPPELDLDGIAAWQTFGELTLDAAYERLRENPEAHQEAFMWMGDRAFAYYFPVIDRYLRNDELQVAFDGIAHILAHDIAMHVPSKAPEMRAVYDQLRRLCAFVVAEVAALSNVPTRSFSITELQNAWGGLLAKLA